MKLYKKKLIETKLFIWGKFAILKIHKKISPSVRYQDAGQGPNS